MQCKKQHNNYTCSATISTIGKQIGFYEFMRYCLIFSRMPLFYLVFLLTLLGSTVTHAANTHQALTDAVVKIYVTSKSSSSYAPWNSDNVTSSGSGFIIEGNRILTNAHVVSDDIFVEIQRDGNPKRYPATVAAISHELDVAVLQVKDESFFTKGKPLALGELPDVHQEVLVYGYPVGGDTLSTTRGIVSRIDYLAYSHSGLSYQVIQIDAAVNAGNSGGPALVNGQVVGIVMQKAEGDGENIGYIIPSTMVKRLLADLDDGKYDGFPAFSAQVENLLNPTLKKKYQLTEQQTGVLVTRVCANTNAETVLKTGDIITHIDGKPIDDDGTTPLNEQKTIYFLHYIDMHQIGETVELGVVRDGKPLNVQLILNEPDTSSYTYDQDPRYFIYGGFVFVANRIAERCLTRERYDESKEKDKKDDVMIAQVLANTANIGFHDLSATTIEQINGQRFNTFEDFYKILKQTPDSFVELTDNSGYKIAIDRKMAETEHQELMIKYRIQQDHSPEIDYWNKMLAEH